MRFSVAAILALASAIRCWAFCLADSAAESPSDEPDALASRLENEDFLVS